MSTRNPQTKNWKSFAASSHSQSQTNEINLIMNVVLLCVCVHVATRERGTLCVDIYGQLWSRFAFINNLFHLRRFVRHPPPPLRANLPLLLFTSSKNIYANMEYHKLIRRFYDREKESVSYTTKSLDKKTRTHSTHAQAKRRMRLIIITIMCSNGNVAGWLRNRKQHFVPTKKWKKKWFGAHGVCDFKLKRAKSFYNFILHAICSSRRHHSDAHTHAGSAVPLNKIRIVWQAQALNYRFAVDAVSKERKVQNGIEEQKWYRIRRNDAQAVHVLHEDDHTRNPCRSNLRSPGTFEIDAASSILSNKNGVACAFDRTQMLILQEFTTINNTSKCHPTPPRYPSMPMHENKINKFEANLNVFFFASSSLVPEMCVRQFYTFVCLLALLVCVRTLNSVWPGVCSYIVFMKSDRDNAKLTT